MLMDMGNINSHKWNGISQYIILFCGNFNLLPPNRIRIEKKKKKTKFFSALTCKIPKIIPVNYLPIFSTFKILKGGKQFVCYILYKIRIKSNYSEFSTKQKLGVQKTINSRIIACKNVEAISVITNERNNIVKISLIRFISVKTFHHYNNGTLKRIFSIVKRIG